MNATNTVSYTPSTPQNLLIDSGAVYKNYGLASEALLSATSGGNEVNIAIKTRTVKVDGIKSENIKGLVIFVSGEATLVVNLLECTTDILKTALMCADIDTSDPNFDLVTGRSSILPTDYIQNIALVGQISGSGKPVVIILYNVLSKEGLKVKTEDDNDNVLPVTFTAHMDPATPKVLPWAIRYPKPMTGNQFMLSSVPMIDNAKILLDFSDTVAATVPLTGFAVTVAGVANVVTAAVRNVNDLSIVFLTLTTPATSGQAVTVSYTKPEADASDVKSLSGVALDTFAAITVTNN